MARAAAKHCGWGSQDRLSAADFVETAAQLRLRGLSKLLRVEALLPPPSAVSAREGSHPQEELRRQSSGVAKGGRVDGAGVVESVSAEVTRQFPQLSSSPRKRAVSPPPTLSPPSCGAASLDAAAGLQSSGGRHAAGEPCTKRFAVARLPGGAQRAGSSHSSKEQFGASMQAICRELRLGDNQPDIDAALVVGPSRCRAGAVGQPVPHSQGMALLRTLSAARRQAELHQAEVVRCAKVRS